MDVTINDELTKNIVIYVVSFICSTVSFFLSIDFDHICMKIDGQFYIFDCEHCCLII